MYFEVKRKQTISRLSYWRVKRTKGCCYRGYRIVIKYLTAIRPPLYAGDFLHNRWLTLCCCKTGSKVSRIFITDLWQQTWDRPMGKTWCCSSWAPAAMQQFITAEITKGVPCQKCPSCGGSDPHLTHGSLASRVYLPNGISISSAIFVQLMVVPNTDRCTHRPCYMQNW